MIAERVSDDLWFTRGDIAGAEVCLYILKGAKLAIVDTGFAPHPGESLDPALRSLGLSLAEVDLILNTHGHPDHLGGNAAVKAASGAAVHLHRADVPWADGPEAHIQTNDDLLGVMRRLGRLAEAAQHETLLYQRVGRNVGVDRILEDGDRIDLGNDIRLTVVATPGHTPGSVSYYVESTGLAFTGDAVQGWGARPGSTPYYHDPLAYRQSLQRLADLNLQTMCLGHPMRTSSSGPGGSPIRSGAGIRETIRESLSFHEALIAAARETPPLDGPIEPWLKAALDRLPESMRVTMMPDGGVPFFPAATMIGHLKAAGRLAD